MSKKKDKKVNKDRRESQESPSAVMINATVQPEGKPKVDPSHDAKSDELDKNRVDNSG